MTLEKVVLLVTNLGTPDGVHPTQLWLIFGLLTIAVNGPAT
jgi:hypothetical protein